MPTIKSKFEHGRRFLMTSLRYLPAAFLFATLMLSGAAHAADLSGNWTGHWKSCETGHTGPLKAKFCRVDACHYEVTFCGRFFKVLPFRYKVKLRVVQEGDTVRLEGCQELGRLMGVYRYSATATRCVFHSRYTSKDDRGYFHLERR